MKTSEALKIVNELNESGRNVVDFDEVSFSIRLRELLDERNMTIADLAREVNVTYANTHAWLEGNVNVEKMKKANLQKLSDYFDVDIDYLKCRQAERRKSDKISADKVKNFYEYRRRKNNYLNICNYTKMNTPFQLGFTDIYGYSEEIQKSLYKGLLITEIGYYGAPEKTKWTLSESTEVDGVKIPSNEQFELNQEEVDAFMDEVADFISFKLRKLFLSKRLEALNNEVNALIDNNK